MAGNGCAFNALAHFPKRRHRFSEQDMRQRKNRERIPILPQSGCAPDCL